MHAQIAHHLPARHGMADQGELGQIKLFDQRGDILGEGIEVVAMRGLIRTAMTAAVKADAAKSLFCQGSELIIPHFRRAAKTVQKQQRRTLPPLPPEELRSVSC